MFNLGETNSLSSWELAMIARDLKRTRTRRFLGLDHHIFLKKINETANEKNIKFSNERIITWECETDLLIAYDFSLSESISSFPKNHKLELGIYSKNYFRRELIFYLGISRIDSLHGMIPYKIVIDKYPIKNTENVFLSTFGEIKYIAKNHINNVINKLQHTFPKENQVNYLLLESGKRALTPWLSVGKLYKKMNIRTEPTQFDLLMLQGKEVRENKKINLQMDCMYEFFNLCHFNQMQ